jgi:hypothetical protein
VSFVIQLSQEGFGHAAILHPEAIGEELLFR